MPEGHILNMVMAMVMVPVMVMMIVIMMMCHWRLHYGPSSSSDVLVALLGGLKGGEPAAR